MSSLSKLTARIEQWKSTTPLRVTRARLCVIEVLLRQQQPSSAEEVFRTLLDQGSDVSLGSVYRILKQMEDEGLLQRERQLSYGGYKAVYSIFCEGEQDCGYWFQCEQCGARQRVADSMLAGQLLKSAALEGYTLPWELVLAARCQLCAPELTAS